MAQIENDAGGFRPSDLAESMQQIMMNNISARCFDLDGRLILPRENYHPEVKGWWESFKPR